MSAEQGPTSGFDRAAAVTRSLLGWGAVAGPFYLGVGLVLALTRPGFDLGRHQLSLLMLGQYGWLQTANLVLSGLMTVAAALGVARATGTARTGTWGARLLGLYGVGLVGGGIFPPDPMGGFPPGAPASASASGILHLAFGALGFLALAGAAVAVAGWFERRGDAGMALYSRASAAVIVAGFVGGAALSALALGIAALWIAVVAGWAWLLVASLRVYRTVPHPDAHRRARPAAPA